MYSFSPFRIPRIVRWRNRLWVMQLCRTRDSDTWAAARMLPRECSSSRSPGGQMHGSIGVFISHKSRATSRFFPARWAASFTAVVVFPDPGLPQTANIRFSFSGSQPESSPFWLRLKILFFKKFKAYPTSLSSVPLSDVSSCALLSVSAGSPVCSASPSVSSSGA